MFVFPLPKRRVVNVSLRIVNSGLLGLVILCMGCSDTSRESDQKKVLLQPYGDFATSDLVRVQKKIRENFPFRVYIAATKPLPRSSYIDVKTPRYRADSIIAILKRDQADSIDYTIGFTTHDISTTKKGKDKKVLQPKSRYQDWGVFGLGYVPGPSCVVSNYRLGQGDLADDRLLKVSLHELGHNLGLPHCDRDPDCVMRDAAESIRTVDLVRSDLCKFCKMDVAD